MAHCSLVDWLAAGKDAKATASKAAKSVKKNIKKKTLKPRYSVVFHRPKTLKRTRDPKYTKKRCVHAAGYLSCCYRVPCVVLRSRGAGSEAQRHQLQLQAHTQQTCSSSSSSRRAVTAGPAAAATMEVQHLLEHGLCRQQQQQQQLARALRCSRHATSGGCLCNGKQSAAAAAGAEPDALQG
jgi:hypothetical protein